MLDVLLRKEEEVEDAGEEGGRLGGRRKRW